MVGSGFLPASYKSLLLPGIIAISMVFTGIWAVAMPLIAEFQWTREIEDRLLAPIDIALDRDRESRRRNAAGAGRRTGRDSAGLAGAASRSGHQHRRAAELFAIMLVLIAIFSACGGLALGCSINQQHIGLMFSMVMTPMIFFGCTYYPWSALKTFPILQKAVLINPLVYASEGMRAALVPQFPHLSTVAILLMLLIFDIGLLWIGLRQFHKKAIS